MFSAGFWCRCTLTDGLSVLSLSAVLRPAAAAARLVHAGVPQVEGGPGRTRMVAVQLRTGAVPTADAAAA